MIADLFSWNGFISMPWWGYVLVALVTTHLTIICVTLFLHRAQAHRSVQFHPAVSHPMRFWLWLTTGLSTKEWVAVHRKHHATVETPEDPHSPVQKGILQVLFRGADIYRVSAMQPEVLEQYGHGTPDDKMEDFYKRYVNIGVVVLAFAAFALFGWAGIAMWAVQMMWIPFFAAGVINGGAHYAGYRNFATEDNSTNLVNIAWLIGGEELHNNHHAFPSSAKFSMKWWEFDAGWMYLTILSKLGLAKIKRMAPMPGETDANGVLEGDTVRNLLSCQLHVMSEYIGHVLRPMFKKELRGLTPADSKRLLSVKSTLMSLRCDDKESTSIVHGLSDSLKTVYDFGCRLQALWANRGSDSSLREALAEWCVQAEESGLQSLRYFATRIKGYTLKPSRVASA